MLDQLLSDFYLFVGWQPYTWFAALAVASALDAATTVYALRKLGAREANPVMRWAMRHLGVVPALLLVKVSALVLMFVTLQDSILYAPLWAVIYAAVAGWNLINIWKGRR